MRKKKVKLFMVLTDKFIGVKMCFLAHFSCKIGTQRHTRALKVLNRNLLLKKTAKMPTHINFGGG